MRRGASLKEGIRNFSCWLMSSIVRPTGRWSHQRTAGTNSQSRMARTPKLPSKIASQAGTVTIELPLPHSHTTLYQWDSTVNVRCSRSSRNGAGDASTDIRRCATRPRSTRCGRKGARPFTKLAEARPYRWLYVYQTLRKPRLGPLRSAALRFRTFAGGRPHNGAVCHFPSAAVLHADSAIQRGL